MWREGQSMFLAITFIYRITLKKDTGDVVVIREGEGELLINLTLGIVSRLNAIWARATVLTAMYKHSICWEAGSVWEARWRCHWEGGREGINQMLIKVNTHKLSTTLHSRHLCELVFNRLLMLSHRAAQKGQKVKYILWLCNCGTFFVCSCP